MNDNSEPLKIRREERFRKGGVSASALSLNRTQHGIFTLIELLVVIAIISLLKNPLLYS